MHVNTRIKRLRKDLARIEALVKRLLTEIPIPPWLEEEHDRDAE